MSCYKQFEDLPVYGASVRLALAVFQLTEMSAFRARGDLKNQLNRASLSISNNIAEGFERGSNRELIQFLGYAKGSSGEVRSMCNVIQADLQPDTIKSYAEKVRSLSMEVNRQLQKWIRQLRDSDFRGSRFQGTRDIEEAEDAKKRDAFWKKLEAMNEESAKQRKEERERNQREQSE